MIRIQFQNGPDAPEIFLDTEEFETAEEAKKRLDSIVHAYGTVPDAVGWLEGTPKPKFGKFADLFARSNAEKAAAVAETAAAEPAPEPDGK
jgi:hypothetical protein